MQDLQFEFVGKRRKLYFHELWFIGQKIIFSRDNKSREKPRKLKSVERQKYEILCFFSNSHGTLMEIDILFSKKPQVWFYKDWLSFSIFISRSLTFFFFWSDRISKWHVNMIMNPLTNDNLCNGIQYFVCILWFPAVKKNSPFIFLFRYCTSRWYSLPVSSVFTKSFPLQFRVHLFYECVKTICNASAIKVCQVQLKCLHVLIDAAAFHLSLCWNYFKIIITWSWFCSVNWMWVAHIISDDDFKKNSSILLLQF